MLKKGQFICKTSKKAACNGKRGTRTYAYLYGIFRNQIDIQYVLFNQEYTRFIKNAPVEYMTI